MRAARWVAILSAGAALLAGCGGSSKPSYCSAVASLKSSVQAVPTTDVISNGTNALKSALTKVENDAKAVVSSAKSDFPNETSAISSSVSALKDSVTALPSGPSVAQVAAVTKDAANVVSSVKSFTDATGSQCN